MPEEFHDCFVGEKGYDALKKLMKNGNEFCTDLSKCLQERNDAEIVYVKALRKNSDTLQKLAGRAKGTLAQALTTLATQTGKEGDAHSLLANTLFNDISIPMKNLAEAQYKERKSIEEGLSSKFKEWNAQKDVDNKYRNRQFEKSKEIEIITMKISEMSNTVKSSTRSKLESAIKKAEEDLEKADQKYHTSTKDVEILRQACDAEMYRSCDQLQKMELERLTEMANYSRIFANAMDTLTQTMQQMTQDLYAINILPSNDIIVQAKSNVQPAELEILLYDIYAENEDNVMVDNRRILSLMKWMEILKRDIEIQRQTKNGPVLNSVYHRGDSSSSSNDDDGAMHHTKRDKKKTEGIKSFSSEVFIDRRGAALLEELYKASLFKIETVYNRIKRLSEPRYEHAQRLTRTFNDKGSPTTFLRIPSQPSTRAPPSAPPTTQFFVQAMPIFVPFDVKPQPMMFASQAPPEPGWNLGEPRLKSSAPDNQMPAQYSRSQPTVQYVRALYNYRAKHTDELDMEQGDVIKLIERRKDDWFKGSLNGKVGLFPGNYVQEIYS